MAGCCEHGNESTGLHKMRRISSGTKVISSEEVIFFMDVINVGDPRN